MLRRWCAWLILALIHHVCSAEEIPLQPSSADKPRGGINFMSYSSDGKLLVTCSTDEVVRIWETQGCTLKGVLSLPERRDDVELVGAAFSPDGKFVASMQRGRKAFAKRRNLVLWNAADGKYLQHLTDATHWGSHILADLEFSPDGKDVWVCEGPTVFRWSIEHNSVKNHRVKDMLHGRLRFISNTAALLVHGMAQLNVVDPVSGKRIFHFNREQLRWGDILKSGDQFVAIANNGSIVLGDVKTGAVEERFRPLKGRPGWIRLFHGGNDLIVVTTTGHVERWNLEKVDCTGKLPQPIGIANFLYDAKLKFGTPNAFIFRTFHATPLVISPDDSQLAVIAGRQFALLPLEWNDP